MLKKTKNMKPSAPSPHLSANNWTSRQAERSVAVSGAASSTTRRGAGGGGGRTDGCHGRRGHADRRNLASRSGGAAVTMMTQPVHRRRRRKGADAADAWTDRGGTQSGHSDGPVVAAERRSRAGLTPS